MRRRLIGVIYLGALAELNGGAGRNGAGAAGSDRHGGDILRLVRASVGEANNMGVLCGCFRSGTLDDCYFRVRLLAQLFYSFRYSEQRASVTIC